MDTATNSNGRLLRGTRAARPEAATETKRDLGHPDWLQLDHRARELALFNLAIDSKLRGRDLVGLRVHDVVQGSHVAARAIGMQKKTQRPVQFEITEQTRDAVAGWISTAHLKPEQFLFPHVCRSGRISRRDIRGSSGRGSSLSGWSRRPTVPTLCAARNRR